MTDLADLPFVHDDGRLPNGAKGRRCAAHRYERSRNIEEPTDPWPDGTPAFHVRWTHETCINCGKSRPIEDGIAASRRGKNNGKRGRHAELVVARLIPGGRKMGPLGLPWDVEVGDYARLQVKQLAARPGPAEIRRLIEAIPDTGDRLRGFVWVEAATHGPLGQAKVVWFTWDEFASWHGIGEASAWDVAGDLVRMPLAEWIAEFVAPDLHGGAK